MHKSWPGAGAPGVGDGGIPPCTPSSSPGRDHIPQGDGSEVPPPSQPRAPVPCVCLQQDPPGRPPAWCCARGAGGLRPPSPPRTPPGAGTQRQARASSEPFGCLLQLPTASVPGEVLKASDPRTGMRKASSKQSQLPAPAQGGRQGESSQPRGTARHGAAWHSTARHGGVKHGAAQHGVAQHSAVWHGTAQNGTARCNMAQQAWHSTARHGTMWHSMARLSTAQRGTARHGTAPARSPRVGSCSTGVKRGWHVPSSTSSCERLRSAPRSARAPVSPLLPRSQPGFWRHAGGLAR